MDKNKYIKKNKSLDIITDKIEPGWGAEEFNSVNFNDKRLNTRFISVVEALASKPTAPINQACKDWADSKAAYRLFDNEKFNPSEIFSVHQKRTVERLKGQKVILNIQDTTYFNYTHHPSVNGLGIIGTHEKSTDKGLIMHTSLATTVQGLPLGLLYLEIWKRDKIQQYTKNELKKIPIEKKESYKWIKSMKKAHEIVPDNISVINVCDREADIFEFLYEAENINEKYLVRAAQDRCLNAETKKLWEFMTAKPVVGNLKVEVAAKDNQPARKANVEVRFSRITLNPSKNDRTGKKFNPIETFAVYVKEKNPPKKVKPLEWMLLTNMTVNNFEEAVEKVSWYCKRWNIEVYFKVLKSGCTVEDCRLETAERLIRYLTLFSIIAWRLFWMTIINRINPDAECTTVLADHEWKALYANIHRTKNIPKELPTVRQVIRWIAQLGGFLGRKRDGEPGITVVWRGWQRVTDISITWLVLTE